jgi:hypothetical protein
MRSMPQAFAVPAIVHEFAERMAEVVGRTVDPVRDHEMFEIGQRQLALHQQHAGVHAKGAVTVECDDRALGAKRDAGGEHRGEAHRRFEVKHPLGLMRDIPPQFRAVAR